jgi:hypothetical protein
MNNEWRISSERAGIQVNKKTSKTLSKRMTKSPQSRKADQHKRLERGVGQKGGNNE